MQKVNFFLRIALIGVSFLGMFPVEGGASTQYVPARKIAVKKKKAGKSLPPGVVRRSSFKRPDTPLSQSRHVAPVYGECREASPHFKKRLAGPYISGALGVQLHSHQGDANDHTGQIHKINVNAQRLSVEMTLGWAWELMNSFFIGAEAGIDPLPAQGNISISDGTTTLSVKGGLGYFMAALLGRHFYDGTSLAYVRLGAEWRTFKVVHQVGDAVIDDTNREKGVFGFSPGVGVGVWLFDSVYTVAEYRSVFYNKFSLTSPGGRLTFNDQKPRVDMFLLKFIIPLNPLLGTRFGLCDE